MRLAGLALGPAPLAVAAGATLFLARWAWRRGRRTPSIADGIVRAARADLDVREEGKNDGPRIRQYFEGSNITPPANWCAAATTTWIREAAREAGLRPPIPGSMQAKKIGEQIRELASTGAADAAWHSAEDLRRDPSLLRPGDVVVWDRSDPAKPETSWYGHVGVVASTGRSFTSIEGNSGQVGDRVAEMPRTVDDPRLIGAGRAWIPGRASSSARSLRSSRTRAAPVQLVPPAPLWEAG